MGDVWAADRQEKSAATSATVVSAFSETEEFILYNDPIPLAWMVAGRGNEFELEWARSADPRAMLRIAAHVVPRSQLVLTVCAVARTLLKYVPKSEKRPLRAIQAAERWARGKATIEEVREAADAAWEAYATNRTHDASRAAFAPFAAGYSTGSVTHVAAAYADDAARRARSRPAAVIVRKQIRITAADLLRAGKNRWAP